jgi:hypothetical protein
LFAECFHLSAAERKTLLVAGAAAGMTAIFGTAAAAILLAVEVLLLEWERPSGLVARADVLRWQVSDAAEDTSLGDLPSGRSLPLAHPDMPSMVVADLMVAEDISRCLNSLPLVLAPAHLHWLAS